MEEFFVYFNLKLHVTEYKSIIVIFKKSEVACNLQV